MDADEFWENSTTIPISEMADNTGWHNILAGVLLSAFVASDIGNVFFIGSVCMKKMRKINSVTMNLVRLMAISGLLTSMFLLIPASFTTVTGKWQFGRGGCVYQRLFLQIFEVSNKFLMVFLGFERLVISMRRRGICMSSAMLTGSLVAIFMISVAFACTTLVENEEYYTRRGVFVCLLPGKWFTITYEIFTSVIPCVTVMSLTLLSSKRTVSSLRQIDETNNAVVSNISRPSLYLNCSTANDVNVLPCIEFRTTFAVNCLNISVASLFLIGSIARLMDFAFYNGDPLLMNVTLVVDAMVCLIQPFLLCVVLSTVRSNLVECVEGRRSIRTRTTASFHITHQQTDSDMVEETSAQVKMPSMRINVKVSSSEKEIQEDSKYNHGSAKKLSSLSMDRRDDNENFDECHSTQTTSIKEGAVSLFYNDKETEDGLMSDNNDSIANSDDSVYVRVGSRMQNSVRQSTSLNSYDQGMADLPIDVKGKLKRSVSDCHQDDLRMSFYQLEETVRFPKDLSEESEISKEDVSVVCARKNPYKLKMDDSDNEPARGLPEVEPQKILASNLMQRSSSSSGHAAAENIVSNCPRTSGIRIEVETEEIWESVWKKESDTGELISSRIITRGGAFREVKPQ